MIGGQDRSRYASALLDLTEALVRDYPAPAGAVLRTVQACLLELGGTGSAPLDVLERDVRARLAADGHLPVSGHRPDLMIAPVDLTEPAADVAGAARPADRRLHLVDLGDVEHPRAVLPGG